MINKSFEDVRRQIQKERLKIIHEEKVDEVLPPASFRLDGNPRRPILYRANKKTPSQTQ